MTKREQFEKLFNELEDLAKRAQDVSADGFTRLKNRTLRPQDILDMINFFDVHGKSLEEIAKILQQLVIVDESEQN